MIDISEKVLNTIKEEKLSPTPKTSFLLKEMLVWTLVGVTATLSFLCWSIIFHFLINSDLDMREYLNSTVYELLSRSLSYFWIAILTALLVLVILEFRKTKSGYKPETLPLISISILSSILFGYIFYYIGLGNKIDQMAKYPNITEAREDMWTTPDNGLLAGEIIYLTTTGNFTIRDFDGNEWEITNTDATFTDKLLIQEGRKIRMAGKKIGTNKFHATTIKSWNQRTLLRKNYVEYYIVIETREI